MSAERPSPRRTWNAKFLDAFRGIYWGMRGQSSFAVHLLAALTVVTVGFLLNVDHTQWCLLLLCITMVLVAEMFNSALELLARVVDSKPNPQLGRALDIASGAVLVAAIGAAVTGLIVLAPRVL